MIQVDSDGEVVYTMVEKAKAHGLNIYGYLKILLEHRPTKEMTDDQLAELAPWSEIIQAAGCIFQAIADCLKNENSNNGK